MDYGHAIAGGVFIVLLPDVRLGKRSVTSRTFTRSWKPTALHAAGCPTARVTWQTRLSMESYQSLMQGTLYGPVIVPGDGRQSILNMVVEGGCFPAFAAPAE